MTETSSSVRQFAGAISLGCGALIAGLSGLCTLLMFFEPGSFNEEDLILIGVIGGVPFAIGIGLFFLGRALLRSDRPSSDPQP